MKSDKIVLPLRIAIIAQLSALISTAVETFDRRQTGVRIQKKTMIEHG
jgi:hypothetical protein